MPFIKMAYAVYQKSKQYKSSTYFNSIMFAF